MTELPLNRRDISGFLNEVPAHGMAGVMGGMALDAGKAAHLVEHRIDHPGVETTVAVGVGGRRQKQCRRFPSLKKGSCPDGLLVVYIFSPPAALETPRPLSNFFPFHFLLSPAKKQRDVNKVRK